MSRGRGSKIVVGVISAIVLLLVLTQLFVPGIAAQQIKKQVDKYGTVESVSVHAFPAIELAWKAGSATVKIKTITVTPKQAVELLEETKKIDELDMYMKNLTLKVPEEGAKPVTLNVNTVKVHKNGNAIFAHASIPNAQLKNALPGGFEAAPVENKEGKFELSLKGGFLEGTDKAIVDGHNGKIQAEIAETGGESLTLFSDHRVSVGAIRASLAGAETKLTLAAKLR
jgi:hypothetical protein